MSCGILLVVKNSSAEQSRHECLCPLAPVCSRSHGPFREVEREKDSLLYLQGEDASHVYFLKEGSVSLHRRLTSTNSLGSNRMLVHGGTFLGMEALSGLEYLDSVRAETPIVLCVAHRDRISALAPEGSAEGRVASWLLERYRMRETTQIPRSVLAELLGMHPGSVSRALSGLKKAGLIEVSRRSLSIVDMEGLQKLVVGAIPLTA